MRKLALILFLFPGLSLADLVNNYYEGLKIAHRNMSFDANYGRSMFTQNFIQATGFLGVSINKNFRAEIEYYITNKKKKTATIFDDNTELGAIFFSGMGNDTYNIRNKISGGGIHLLAHAPIYKSLNIISSVGVNYVSLKINADLTMNHDYTATSIETSTNQIRQQQSKLIPKISCGLDWKIFKYIGVRTDISWERTSKIKINFMTPAASPNWYEVRPKNSIIYSLGLYVTV